MFSHSRFQLSQLLAQRSGSYEVNSLAEGDIQSGLNVFTSRKTERPTTTTTVELTTTNNDTTGNDRNTHNKPNNNRTAIKLSSPLRSISSKFRVSNNNNSNSKLATLLPFEKLLPAETKQETRYTNNNNPYEKQDGVTLCTLGVGTTFGASVMPGKSHSVSVVTSDDCTLLRVRRADFQEIFNEQSHLINNVESSPFCSFTSLNRMSGAVRASHSQIEQQTTNNPDSNSARFEDLRLITRRKSSSSSITPQTSTSSYSQTTTPQVVASNGLLANTFMSNTNNNNNNNKETQQKDDLNDLNLDSIDSNELSGHLMRVGWVLRTVMLEQSSRMIQNRLINPRLRLHHQNQNRRHQQKNKGLQSSVKVSSNLKQVKQLVSVATSSQLLSNSSSTTTKSAASLAGRRVANYVTSSFMRTGKPSNSQVNKQLEQQQQQQKQVSCKTSPSHALFTSNSFDANPQQQQQGSMNNLSQGNSNSSSSNNTTLVDSTSNLNSNSNSSSNEPVLFRRCMIGSEMVDWLVELSQTNTNASRFVSSRLQAVSMWQVLLEQGIVFAFTSDETTCELCRVGIADGSGGNSDLKGDLNSCCSTFNQFQFCDEQQAYYKFWFDREGTSATTCSQQQQQQQDGLLLVSKQTKFTPTSLSLSSSNSLSTSTTSSSNNNNNNNNNSINIQRPSEQEIELASESLWWSLRVLSKLAPDACFRLILSKQPHDRSLEEVDIVYEELQHLKALSHLTNSVKKELAACVRSEHHAKQNTVIFNQGDVGHSWYIILRGSVNVVIVGRGVVCTMHEGDDFGKLALVNDAPRAATIVTNEPNCYFLRVDKHNFNTILRDVEANTVRLKEHGKEVLILQKVPVKEPTNASTTSGTMIGTESGPLTSGQTGQPDSANSSLANQASQQQQQAHQQTDQTSGLKYMVMAGTGEKMLEHLLETRVDGQTQIGPLTCCKSGLIEHDQVSSQLQCLGDNFLEDFILTHKIFMPTANLCQELLKQYQTKGPNHQLPVSSSKSLAGSTVVESTNSQEDEYLIAKKRRVVKFIRCWMLVTREHFFHQQQIQSFLTAIHQRLKQDAARFASLQPELKAIARILELHLEEELEGKHKGVQRWIDDIYGNILPLRRYSGAWELGQASSTSASERFLNSLHQRRLEHKQSAIQAEDELVFRVYCADHSFATLKARVDSEAGKIKQMAANKLNLEDKNLILVHVKSNGERIIYNDLDFNISTSLSVNGKIFVCPLDHIDAVSPLPEQDPFQEVYQSLSSGSNNTSNQQPSDVVTLAQSEQQLASNQPSTVSTSSNVATGNNSSATTTTSTSSFQQTNEQATGAINSHLLSVTPTNYNDIKTQMSLSVNKLEEFSSRDIAYCLTQLAWSLLKNMHEVELIYTVFGRNNFKQITANLNVFLRHFNEIQYWVVTQICLSTSLSKRVQILRKFIKIAAHCKELQNLNAFFAIIMGLSNMAVARLTQTWERLPSKLKRTFSQFESLIDPSRNHRRYRIFISKMEPPIIPFMPLFLKDMTFAHEGNKTYLENGLINFEKMQMVAQTLRTIRYCKSRPMKLDPSACKFKGSIRSIELFFRDLKIIDNQRTLTQMSHHLEHRKT